MVKPESADAGRFRAEEYLPESVPLRLVRGFATVVAAASWGEARRLLLDWPDLASPESLALIDELTETARKDPEPRALVLIQAYRSWVAEASRHNPGSTTTAPRVKPSIESSRIGSLLALAVRIRGTERQMAEAPSKAHIRRAQREWRSLIKHSLFRHTPERWRLDALNAAGNCFLFGGVRLRDARAMYTAMELYRKAADRAGPESKERHRYRYNLGRAYFTRYDNQLGDAGDLHRAVELIASALSEAPPGFPLRPAYVLTLASALDREYMRSGSIEHLEHSIQVQEEVLGLRFGEPLRGALLSSLGSAYRKRFQRSDELADLGRSIARHEEALRWARKTDHEAQASRNTNLGSALLDKHALMPDPKDLERAIKCFERSVELTDPSIPAMASRLNNLGNGLSQRHRVGDIFRAVDCYQQACDISPRLDPQLASRWFNLGNALANLPDRRAVERRRAAYRKAVACGLVNSLEWALAAARNWGDWALDREAWREAATAYRFGLEALERLLLSQFRRSSKEAWLREAPTAASRAAYALARMGHNRLAVATLERGRARLLAEALERARLDLDALADMGHGDVLARFEKAGDRMAALTSEAATSESAKASSRPALSELRDAKAQYSRALRAIRQVPQFRHFLVPMRERQIRELAVHSPLVYIIATPVGGIALVVRRDEPPAVVELAGLTDHGLRNQAEMLLGAYWGRAEARATWLAAVDDCGQWLGQLILAPLESSFQEAGRAVLIPGGLLGLLPFGAAWIESGSPVRRRYFLDEVRLTQIPSARALGAAMASLPPVAIGSILAVGDPEPISASPLPLARYEATVAAASRPGSTCRLGREATLEAIDPGLQHHGILHFACHAAARPDAPLESALFFADDTPLSLQTLLTKNLDGVRLTLLSACETGVPGLALPDEVVSLASGLLHAGVSGVIASLWAVGDDSTAFLMENFYQHLGLPGAEPAEAFRQAQLDLRESTAGDLAERAASIMALADEKRGVSYAVASKLWRRLVAAPAESRPYAHPVYWAGFGYYGV